MSILAALLSLLVGAIVGLLGGGGSILTLPMLVYLLGMDGKQGIASSLFVVGTTSLVGVATHATLGNVRWKVGFLFGAIGMTAAFVAGNLARWIPERALLFTFATVMVATAVAMMRGRRSAGASASTASPGRIALLGSSVGMVSGLVGAGGGFLIVPALSLFAGLPMAEAIGTSLFVISMQAFAGFGGHATHVELDWRLLGVITTASVVGSVAGAMVGRRTPQDLLRRGFAWLVLGMGLFILGREIPRETLDLPLAGIGGAVLLVATLGVAVRNLKWNKSLEKGKKTADSSHFDEI